MPQGELLIPLIVPKVDRALGPLPLLLPSDSAHNKYEFLPGAKLKSLISDRKWVDRYQMWFSEVGTFTDSFLSQF